MRAVVAALDGVGLISVGGPDAATFLQNMLTCDVREVSPSHWTPGALCTNKGRVTAYFDLSARDGHYLVRLRGAVLEPTLTQLRGTVFRSKVHVDDATGELALLGVAGPEAPQALATLVPVPDAPFDAARRGELTVLRYAGPVPRFEIAGPPESLRALRDALAADVAVGGVAEWDLVEIEAGVPEVGPATREAFLPQFLDLDRRGGLSFTKGCYPGQEVVARTQHLGEVKRRLYAGRIEAGDPPHPGTRLRAVHDDGERDGGTVLRSACGIGGGVHLLAVIPVAEREAARLIRLPDPDGREILF